MPAVYEIRFLPEGRVAHFVGSRGNYYEFPDGSHLDVQTTPVWCRRCGRVTNGEQIESLEEIDRQLADLRDPRSELYRLLAKDYQCEHKNLGEAFTRLHSPERERRRLWRERRGSPPRCIHCGTTDIVVFPMNEAVPNPSGPGTVEVRCVGMCSTRFNEWFFTPEGERIPRDTEPTYWHHPGLDNSPGAAWRFLNRLRRAGRRPGR
jgi:hypothetical protein